MYLKMLKGTSANVPRCTSVKKHDCYKILQDAQVYCGTIVVYMHMYALLYRLYPRIKVGVASGCTVAYHMQIIHYI